MAFCGMGSQAQSIAQDTASKIMHYVFLNPTSHNGVLGLMAQQHASEILPIRFG